MIEWKIILEIHLFYFKIYGEISTQYCIEHGLFMNSEHTLFKHTARVFYTIIPF